MGLKGVSLSGGKKWSHTHVAARSRLRVECWDVPLILTVLHKGEGGGGTIIPMKD